MTETELKQEIVKMVDCGCHTVSLEAVERVAKYFIHAGRADRMFGLEGNDEDDIDLMYNFIVFDRKLEVTEK
jgi:hypothetical protein